MNLQDVELEWHVDAVEICFVALQEVDDVPLGLGQTDPDVERVNLDNRKKPPQAQFGQDFFARLTRKIWEWFGSEQGTRFAHSAISLFLHFLFF